MRLRTTLSTLVVLFLFTMSGCASSPETEVLESIRDVTFIPQLGSYDDNVQKHAINVMLEGLDRAPEVSANILATSLRDEVYDSRTKLVVAWLLAKVHDERAIPTLLGSVGSQNDVAAVLVREALAVYGSSVVPFVAEVLETGDSTARLGAAQVLVDLDLPESRDAMWRRLAGEPDPRVRFMIICGIADDPRANTGDRLVKCLDDPDELIRDIAWGVLSKREAAPQDLFDPTAEDDERALQIRKLALWRVSHNTSGAEDF